jgi:hypothetical protein
VAGRYGLGGLGGGQARVSRPSSSAPAAPRVKIPATVGPMGEAPEPPTTPQSGESVSRVSLSLSLFLSLRATPHQTLHPPPAPATVERVKRASFGFFPRAEVAASLPRGLDVCAADVRRCWRLQSALGGAHAPGLESESVGRAAAQRRYTRDPPSLSGERCRGRPRRRPGSSLSIQFALGFPHEREPRVRYRVGVSP